MARARAVALSGRHFCSLPCSRRCMQAAATVGGSKAGRRGGGTSGHPGKSCCAAAMAHVCLSRHVNAVSRANGRRQAAHVSPRAMSKAAPPGLRRCLGLSVACTRHAVVSTLQRRPCSHHVPRHAARRCPLATQGPSSPWAMPVMAKEAVRGPRRAHVHRCPRCQRGCQLWQVPPHATGPLLPHPFCPAI